MEEFEPAAKSVERKEVEERTDREHYLGSIEGLVPKLKDDGNNIETWLVDIEIEFGMHDHLWDIVQGVSTLTGPILTKKKFAALKILQTSMMRNIFMLFYLGEATGKTVWQH